MPCRLSWRTITLAAWVLTVLWAGIPPLSAQTPNMKPEVWMMPPPAADYSRMKELNLADDATWYVGVMRQGNDYAFVGGAPDQYVIESWVGAPSRAVPEDGDWTFTRSVRDFSRRFVNPKR
jgi:hypothetical protein